MIEKIFTAVVVSFLLLCAGMGGVVLVYMWLIWYASLRHRSNRGQRASEGNGKPLKQLGLSAADLQRLPTIECGKGSEGEECCSRNGQGVYDECAVCLEVFQSGDRCRVIPACSHTFHVLCADAWLSKSSVCPICRRSVACESDGAAEVLTEEMGCDEESGTDRGPPPVESIVIHVPNAIIRTDYRS